MSKYASLYTRRGREKSSRPTIAEEVIRQSKCARAMEIQSWREANPEPLSEWECRVRLRDGEVVAVRVTTRDSDPMDKARTMVAEERGLQVCDTFPSMVLFVRDLE